MIHDLTGRGIIESQADFIIIGAGTAGLPVSTRLARETGLKIICLESGGHHQNDDTHPLNEVVHLESIYAGATQGRFRCLGGTSTRWGGALIPFQDADINNAQWPIPLSELEPYLATVETMFGLETGPYADVNFPFTLGHHHINRLAKWPAFKKRNVANLTKNDYQQCKNLEVWVNATVTKITPTEDNGTKGIVVEVCSPAGDLMKISAPKLIIAAGAIETTRLTLLIDQQHNNIISKTSPSIGCYFTDHLSTEIAEIHPKRLNALNKLIGFRFNRSGGMRNIRFEMRNDSSMRMTLPPNFAHLGFSVTQPGGFDALRELFRWLQMRRIPPLRIGKNLLKNIPWLAKAVWWRFVHQRLLFPNHLQLIVHMVIEQASIANNRITLSQTKNDIFGLPLAEISWQATATDIDNLNKAADLFEETWQATEFSSYGEWQRFPAETVSENIKNSGGVFHPTGSTRMGSDAQQGVVDPDLKIFALPQIQLLATSVLPSGGGANPTMMLMLLAMRCVDQHIKSNNKQQ